MFTSDDEYRLLIEAVNTEWDSENVHSVLKKATERYVRCMRAVNFGEFSSLEKMMNMYLQLDTVATPKLAFKWMKNIDMIILDILNTDNDIDSASEDEENNSKRTKVATEEVEK